jgi:hypothetical protein
MITICRGYCGSRGTCQFIISKYKCVCVTILVTFLPATAVNLQHQVSDYRLNLAGNMGADQKVWGSIPTHDFELSKVRLFSLVRLNRQDCSGGSELLGPY